MPRLALARAHPFVTLLAALLLVVAGLLVWLGVSGI
jgi:hypothetical protein